MFDLIPAWVKAAILGGCLLIGAAGGWYATRVFYQREIAQTALAQAQAVIDAGDKARAAQTAADKITHDADVKNAKAHQQIVTVTNTIIRKVPSYVTAQTDSAFPLPCGFIRLHDAAAGDIDPATVPLPAGKSDGDRCDVAASAAAAIIAENYGTALGWQADLKTWGAWYADQKAAWDVYLSNLKASAK
jgi:hypothetical protein